MQVDFDATYLREENEAQRKLKAWNKIVNGHKTSITDVEMEDASDYEALTTLYRKIFRFLLEFVPNTKNLDRAVEREIAAALESVFPRVGLKAFIQLSYEEKVTQLMELARIILGIRLFNRDEGRGGAGSNRSIFCVCLKHHSAQSRNVCAFSYLISGIDDMDTDSNILANVLAQDIDREVEFFTDACAKYQRALIKAHLARRKKAFDEYEAEYARNNPSDDDDMKVHKSTDNATKNGLPASASTNPLQVREVDSRMIDRWSKEMANRRQYLGFLKTLQDEAKYLLEKIGAICSGIKQELQNVRALVSNKNAVPKEIVYPRFDALGALWIQLFEEVLTMIARSNTFQELCKFRLSFTPTLSERFYLDAAVADGSSLAKMMHDAKNGASIGTELSTDQTKNSSHVDVAADGAPGTEAGAQQQQSADDRSVSSMPVDGDAPQQQVEADDRSVATDEASRASSAVKDTAVMVPTASEESNVGQPAADEARSASFKSDVPDDDVNIVHAGANDSAYSEAKDDMGERNVEQQQGAVEVDESPSAPTLAPAGSTEEENRIYDDIRDIQGASSDGPKLLSVVNTPDFMLLPLELQGYCPWTIVEARGLLIPGKPALGIVRYDNHYYVFDHPLCIKAFILNPQRYLSAIKDRALRNPEYINLLQLQKWFPTASIAKLLKQHELETNNKTGQPLTKDASTGTPTHFIDSYIDINYHWNEWELRRRALKIVNLKKCATTGQQTDDSHFRRDNETQVYPHRIKGTQTKRDKGTNPPTVSTYVAGLRGKQIMAEEKKAMALALAAGNPPEMDRPWLLEHPPSGMVSFTLDDTISAADNIKSDYYNPKV